MEEIEGLDAIDFINIDGDDFDDLGPPPNVGPTPVVGQQTLQQQNDFDDLEPPPIVGVTPPQIGEQVTAAIGDFIQINNTSTTDKSWQCAETLDVDWKEDDYSGNILSVNEYKIMSSLGSGSFASVYEVERQKGDQPYRRFALKSVSKSRLSRIRLMRGTGLDMIRNEIEVMRTLYHRNIVLLFEVLDQYEHDSLGLILEYCVFGSCMEFQPSKCRYFLGKHALSKLNPSNHEEEENFQETQNQEKLEIVGLYFRGLVQGLRYLHDLGIAHRDIKPDNLLIYENGTLRIADFGCARRVLPEPPSSSSSTSSALPSSTQYSSLTSTPISISQSAMVYDSIGTEVFYAPEICQGNGYNLFQADVWAAGCCLCCFVHNGMIPFDPRLPYDLLMNSILEHPPTLNSIETPPLYHHHTVSSEKDNVIAVNNIGGIGSEGIFSELITAMLEKDPSKRISLERAESHSCLQFLPPDSLSPSG